MRSPLSRLLTIVVLFAIGQAHAADVGRVLLAAGDTVAVRDKQIIRLVFRSTVQDKDVLRTGPASNLQVRFTDESILSMRENSEIRIDEFRFTGKEDGSERAFFSLLKGGLRKITGIIGRTNNKNYQMGSVVATIGIRGTDYAATLCQRDCYTNPSHQLAPDGLYARVIGPSFGTNQLDFSTRIDQQIVGISQNVFAADANSRIEFLLEAPGFLNAPVKGKSAKPPAGTGNEQAAAGGAEQDPRGTTAPPPPPEFLQFVATEERTASGAPAVISASPTIAGVGAFMETSPFNESGEGGGFFTPANLTTDPIGAASDLALTQKLTGFTLPPGFEAHTDPNTITVSGSTSSASVIDQTMPNSLNAHWGRWTSGTFTDESGTTTFSMNNQFHYLYGPLTPPEVVAAKTGSFPMSMVQGTTPTNQLGQFGTLCGPSCPTPPTLTVDFTGRTVTFPEIRFSFPSDTFIFPGPNSTPIQFAAGKGAFIDHQGVSGSCSGSTCLTSTPAVLDKTGIFMGQRGDHLGVAFGANTTSGPSASAQTAKIFTCAPSC